MDQKTDTIPGVETSQGSKDSNERRSNPANPDMSENPEVSRDRNSALKQITDSFLDELKARSKDEITQASYSEVRTVFDLLKTGHINEKTAIRTLGDIISSLRQKNQQLKTNSMLSEKADTINSRGFYEVAKRVLDANNKLENPQPISVAFVDLAGFKKVNDVLHHNIGDLVIRAVADYLSVCVRKGDVVAHKQGDEYLILFLNMNAQDALTRMIGFRNNETSQLMQDLLEIAKTVMGEDNKPLIDPAVDLASIPISMSIGVSQVKLTVPSGAALEMAINEADTNMRKDNEALKEKNPAFSR